MIIDNIIYSSLIAIWLFGFNKGGGGGGAINTPTFTPKILSFEHVENDKKIAYFSGYK